MGIVRTGESEYDKELARWNTPRNKEVSGQPGVMGFGAVGYEEYPKMLYKAFPDDTGKVKCGEPPPQMYLYADMPSYQRAEAVAAAFTRRCQTTVKSAGEEDRAYADGWRPTQADALAYYEGLQQDIAQAAAEADFRAKRMTPAAQAELEAAHASTSDHVVDVVPKKQGGRRKPVAVTAVGQ